MRQVEMLGEQQNRMRAAREEAVSRFLLRSLGQQQSSFEQQVTEWGRLAASADSAQRPG